MFNDERTTNLRSTRTNPALARTLLPNRKNFAIESPACQRNYAVNRYISWRRTGFAPNAIPCTVHCVKCRSRPAIWPAGTARGYFWQRPDEIKCVRLPVAFHKLSRGNPPGPSHDGVRLRRTHPFMLRTLATEPYFGYQSSNRTSMAVPSNPF